MARTMKAMLAALAGAALLSGCATGPYYQDGYNGYGYDNGYYGNGYYANGLDPNGYAYGPSYYAPGYVAPSVGFGITYTDRDDGHHHYSGDRDGRREWRGDNRREWRGGESRDQAIVRQQEFEARQMDRNDAERNSRLGAGG